jgi:predicted kinase
MAMLIVFAGLPGVGKTTLARALAQRLDATCLRIDAIEQALRATRMLPDDLRDAGYVVAGALAREELGLGRTVVADCVNPIALTRNAWRGVALAARARLAEIEIICSDADEHRRRVETRSVDIPGFSPPTWRQVCARLYEPWDGPHLVIDTAGRAAADSLAELCSGLELPSGVARRS